MARRRLREGIVAGIQTILGQLAQFFRLGPSGAIQPGEIAEAGRERLRTPQEIVSVLSQRHQLPTEDLGPRRSYSYIVVWYDVDNGERVGDVRIQVEAPPDAPRSTVYSRARREALLALETESPQPAVRQRVTRMSLRLIGTTDLPVQT